MRTSLLKRSVDALAERARMAFTVVLPDGDLCQAGVGEPRFRPQFQTEGALLAAATRGHMGLLESYFDQEIEVQGDFAAAFAAGLAAGLDQPANLWERVENRLHEWRHTNRDEGHARSNARAHYGLPEAFYRLWLDEPLKLYTCAYWAEGIETLEAAQRAKIELVCRKIRLAAGDRFVDMGCGFGGFLLHAAQTTGASGTGINTTPEQVQWLQGEIERLGLQRQLEVRAIDLRKVGETYDKVVSIGVLEHAGRDQLGAVVQAHADALRSGGLGLMHFIGHVGHHETDLFIRKHLFPGGWIPSLADVIVELERSGLEVVDIENLRRHYALTLDEWARRFEAAWPRIQALDPARFDERFRRVWRSYLVGCAEMFRSPAGYTHLFQIVFSKGNVTPQSYPMSRACLYG